MTTGHASGTAGQQPERKVKKPARIRHFFASRGWAYWPYVAIMAAVGTYFNVILNNLTLAPGLALTALFFIVAPPTVMALILESIRDEPEYNPDSREQEA